MGISIFGNSYKGPGPQKYVPPNPDPEKFKLIDIQYSENNNYVLVEIQYFGCTTFEGKKLSIYKTVDFASGFHNRNLDPHFSDVAPSPIARFAPTPLGRHAALTVLEKL